MLSFDEFKQLRSQGLSEEQIAKFDNAEPQKGLSQSSFMDKASHAMQIANPGMEAAKGIAQGYGDVRNSVQTGIEDATPEFKVPYVNPKPIGVPGFGMLQESLFPSGKNPLSSIAEISSKPEMLSSKKLAREGAGLGFDQLATFGLLKGVPAVVKGTDKQLTSVLRRFAGQSSEDIKLGRELMREGGVSNVMSKTKAKPEYLGREITPKATELASSRVRSMNPDAMREIGIGSEDVKLAQDMKGKFGLTEFPTDSSADEYFQKVINSAPAEARITPNNAMNKLNEIMTQMDPRDADRVRKLLEGSAGYEERMFGSANKSLKSLSPEEYRNIRTIINDMTEGGKNPFMQQIKTAFDVDGSAALPELEKAKGMFQVSRQVPKAEPFLDKARLGNEMQSKLSSAANPTNVQERESLGRLLGDEGKPLIKDVQAQRLAKNWYSNESTGNSLSRPRPNIILESIKELGKPIPRGYEKMRAGAINLMNGKKPISIPSQPTNTSNYVPKQPIIGNTSQPSVYSGGAKGQSMGYEPPVPELDPFQYKGGSSNYSGPEILSSKPNVPYGLSGGGKAGQFSFSDVQLTPEPSNPIPYKGGASKLDISSIKETPKQPYGESLSYKENIKRRIKK